MVSLSAVPELDELTMEHVVVELESACEEKMRQAIETEEGLGIEYDEDVVCDVCRSPEGEDGNEMVFCDKCNVCVHQVRRGDGRAAFAGLWETPPDATKSMDRWTRNVYKTNRRARDDHISCLDHTAAFLFN